MVAAVIAAVMPLAVDAARAERRAAEIRSGPQVGDPFGCLVTVWLVNWPHDRSFRGCMMDALSPASPIAIVFTRSVDERVAELVQALDFQVTEWGDQQGPKAFVCGIGGLEHEDMAELKRAAVDVPLVLPGRGKVPQEQIKRLRLNEQAAVTVVIRGRGGKVTANYAFAETKELTRKKIKEVVKALLEGESE
jgi:hypothetical protein